MTPDTVVEYVRDKEGEIGAVARFMKINMDEPEPVFPIFTKSKVWAAEFDEKDEAVNSQLNESDVSYVTRKEHFAIPTTDVDCEGCPKSSSGSYLEWSFRCQEAARRVIKAKADLMEISQQCRPMSLATHPATLKASDPRRAGQHVVLKSVIEVVDHPSGDVPMTTKELIDANNFDFTLVVDPANQEPTRGRKKRARVEFLHTFDTKGGDGIGRHQ